MRYLLLLLLLLLVPLATDAQEVRCKHFFMGEPEVVGWIPREIIIRDSYAMLPDPETKFASWVAYRLTPHEVIGTLDLKRKWRADPWLRQDMTLEPSPDDYKGASKLGYDRGHLAPLGSFKGSRFASQVNYYSNIVPQQSKLNQGPWRVLETVIRELVLQTGEVFVLTGPLYEKDMPPLPNADEPHIVPSGFWKIIAVTRGFDLTIGVGASYGPKAVGFIMQQDVGNDYDSIRDFIVPIQEIETRAEIRVFPEMSNPAAIRLIKGTVPWYWVDDTVLKGGYYNAN